MALCRTCQRVFDGRFNVYEDFFHHWHREQLEQAAFEQCPICSKLWSIACPNPPRDQGDIGWLDSDDDMPRLLGESDSAPRYYTSCRMYTPASEPPDLYFEVWTGKRHETITFYLIRITDADGGFEDSLGWLHSTQHLPNLGEWGPSMNVARGWLRQCMTKHEKCRRSACANKEAVMLPTRLLQIGSPSPGHVRLVCPGPGSGALQYATVSHCWGSPTSHTVQLNSQSASRLQQGIEIADLGQTFRDVIGAAQWLGIHYIWIDSLCIYQDSKDDWAKESALMSSVYRNGTINIAATVARDGRAGCFPRRDITPKACVVQTAWDNFDNGTFGVYVEHIWREFREENKRLPLLSRGWVLQEMLLAPRALHLAGDQLIWECHTVDACEEAAFGVQTSVFQHRPSAKWRAFTCAHQGDCVSGASLRTASNKAQTWKTSTSSKQEQREHLHFWSAILREYTRKSFTYHTDKLVALSGIARLMAKGLGPEYYAGLWGRWMASELCWTAARNSIWTVGRKGLGDARPAPLPQDLPPRPSPYRAPSWSWACLEEPILSGQSYRLHDGLCSTSEIESHRANVVNADTKDEDNGFEELVESRALVDILDCHVQTATDDMMGAVTGGTLRVCGRLVPLEIQLDGESEKDSFSVLCNGSRWTFLGDDYDGDCRFTMTLDCKPPSLRFHCLPILDNLCLLLCPTGKQRGQFERYGLVGLHPRSGSLWDCLLPVNNEDWLEFESQLEDGRCILSIV